MKKTYIFKNPKFVKSATSATECPIMRDLSGNEVPEIAVVGRSNVGKSSLINDLFQVKGLAKTSSTPGKTRLINFFLVNNQIAFVDLPGYGYASVSLQIKKDWERMVQGYLEERKKLALILFLFDIRREPNEDDYMLLDWISFQQKAMILVFTKVDKVSASEKTSNTKKILKAFSAENIQYVHYSSTKNEGRAHLIASMNEALIEEGL